MLVIENFKGIQQYIESAPLYRQPALSVHHRIALRSANGAAAITSVVDSQGLDRHTFPAGTNVADTATATNKQRVAKGDFELICKCIQPATATGRYFIAVHNTNSKNSYDYCLASINIYGNTLVHNAVLPSYNMGLATSMMLKRVNGTITHWYRLGDSNPWVLAFTNPNKNTQPLYIHAGADGGTYVHDLRASGFDWDSTFANTNFVIHGSSISKGVDPVRGGFFSKVKTLEPFSGTACTFNNQGVNGAKWVDLISQFDANIQSLYDDTRNNVLLLYETSNQGIGAWEKQLEYCDKARLLGWRIINVTSFDRLLAPDQPPYLYDNGGNIVGEILPPVPSYTEAGNGYIPQAYGYRSSLERSSNQMLANTDRIGRVVEGRIWPFNDGTNQVYWDQWGVHPKENTYDYISYLVRDIILDVKNN